MNDSGMGAVGLALIVAGFLTVALAMWALVRIRGSFGVDFVVGNKVIWTLVVLFVPIVGVAIWYLVDWNRRLARNT